MHNSLVGRAGRHQAVEVMPRLHRFALIGSALVLVYLLSTLLFSSSPAPYTSIPADPFRRSEQSKSGLSKSLKWKSSPSNSDPTDVEVDRLGLTHYDGSSSTHPIELLIQRGKQQAAALEGRINEVHNLDHAVEEYERGFGMPPPRGFERWFKFTQAGEGKPSVPVAPLFPMVHEPFVQYLAHPAGILRERAAELKTKAQRYSLTMVEAGKGDMGTECEAGQDWVPQDWSTRGRGRVLVQGDGAWKWRCK